MSDSPEQFLTLFVRHESDLRAFIGSVVRDPSLRDDVFQEVSLTLWRKFETYDHARSFGAWARGIAVYKVMENRRSEGRFPLTLPMESLLRLADAFASLTEGTSAASREEALRSCMETVPEKGRRLLQLRYGDRRTLQETAQSLGLSADAAYQALSRLRDQLKECISRRLAHEQREEGI